MDGNTPKYFRDLLRDTTTKYLEMLSKILIRQKLLKEYKYKVRYGSKFVPLTFLCLPGQTRKRPKKKHMC